MSFHPVKAYQYPEVSDHRLLYNHLQYQFRPKIPIPETLIPVLPPAVQKMKESAAGIFRHPQRLLYDTAFSPPTGFHPSLFI